MKCYGHSYNTTAHCKKCELRSYCKNAGDPPLIANQMIQWNEVDEFAEVAEVVKASFFLEEKPEDNEKLYTRSDLLEVIGFLMAMDLQTLDMLDEKLQDPGISFSAISRKRGITRQAVHKYIKKHCEKIPELKKILMNHSQKKKTFKTFKEAVCQIQKKMSAKKSKKQREGLKSSKKLICSNRNFNLSKMNILRGSIIIKKDLKLWTSNDDNQHYAE